jgi:hypothetical protein
MKGTAFNAQEDAVNGIGSYVKITIILSKIHKT